MATTARPPASLHRSASSLSHAGPGGSFNAGVSSASVNSTPVGTPPPTASFSESQNPAPLIYSAVYSGVSVYEMTVNNVAVMRRRDDDWLNATQILKVAGVEKGKRTKVLEKEILTGVHEKVQGGYGKYQGTWINFERGKEFCRRYAVEDVLRPLLEYNPHRDGVDATPTKEQAMAAKRKRMYNSSSQAASNSQGNYFSNISETASTALAAISKAAQYDTNPRATPKLTPQNSFNIPQSQESTQNNTYPMEASFAPTIPDQTSNYGGSFGPNNYGNSAADLSEPPRKRFRPTPDSEQQQFGGTFVDVESTPRALLPIVREPTPSTEKATEILTSLFISPPSAGPVSYEDHPDLQQLTAEEIELPIDKMGHTAMHWAAALANIPLIKTLVSKGASVLRVNFAGETPLIRGCLVTNNLENSTFPALLDLLHLGISVVDDSGRTVLHHIALMSGIKGRSQASRYYLESLLEFVVKYGAANSSNPNSKGINLGRFMSEIVNAQDKSGDTALNIAARIGNKSIVSQLLEVGADPAIPNRAGLCPLDFGVGGDPVQIVRPRDQPWVVPQNVLQKSEDIVTSMTSMISGLDGDFQAEIKEKQTEIDATHTQLREITLKLSEDRRKLEMLRQRINEKAELGQKSQNLNRAAQEEKRKFLDLHNKLANGQVTENDLSASDPNEPYKLSPEMVNGDFKNLTATQSQYLKTLPPASILKARTVGYELNEKILDELAQTLRGRSLELEANIKKVVALCAGVEENMINDVLGGLLQSVESEPVDVDTARLTSFLRKVQETQTSV
ncbi:transcriptional regulator swi6 [Orbilia oligospora]|uniref:Transcriptional regulator swi6 n=1 Tax=Orbilia oligospora TaxID=2813651 RepID=A0A7C8TW15_ORBOL|nr:transcriptional regulator swi6 [Orbilia oligospora]